jgi:hypothetical protein
MSATDIWDWEEGSLLPILFILYRQFWVCFIGLVNNDFAVGRCLVECLAARAFKSIISSASMLLNLDRKAAKDDIVTVVA